MLELWAKKNNIDIILLQETKVNQAGVEKRKHYTIFFSESVEAEGPTTHAGVAIMIKNSMLESVLEINPIDERLMSITLRGPVHTTFINTYMYTAKDTEKKDIPNSANIIRNTRNTDQHL